MPTLRLVISCMFVCAAAASSFTRKGVWVPRTRSRGHYHEMSGTKYSCESKCVSEPRCASVTFQKRSNRGHCYLHQQVSEEPNYADKSWSQFVKTSSKKIQDEVCFGVHTRGHWLRYRKLTGNDYKKIQTKCPMACGVECDKDPKCVGASVPIPVAYSRYRYTTCTLHSNLKSGSFVKLTNMQSAFYVKIEKSTTNEGFWFPRTRIESVNAGREKVSERQCERECKRDPRCAAASIMKTSTYGWRKNKNKCYKSRTIRSKTNYNKLSSYNVDTWQTFIKTKSSATCSTTHNRGYWFRQLSLSTTTLRTELAQCYDDCASLCEKTKRCHAAVYIALMKSCKLKTSYDDKRVTAEKSCDIYIKLSYDKESEPEPDRQPEPEKPAPEVKVPASRIYKFCKTKAAHPYHCPELWLSTEYRIHSQQDCQNICSGRGSCRAYFNDNEKHGKWDNHCLLMVGLCTKKEADEEPVEYFRKSQTQEC